MLENFKISKKGSPILLVIIMFVQKSILYFVRKTDLKDFKDLKDLIDLNDLNDLKELKYLKDPKDLRIF